MTSQIYQNKFGWQYKEENKIKYKNIKKLLRSPYKQHILYIGQDVLSSNLCPFKRLGLMDEDAPIITTDCELLAKFRPRLSDNLFLGTMGVVEPTVPEDGERDGSVDADEPGDVEFEFTLRFRYCN